MKRFLELAQAGKFYQLTQEVLAEIPKLSQQEAEAVYTEVIMANYCNLHVSGFAEMASEVANMLPHKQAVYVLENALSLLLCSENSNPYEGASLVTQSVHFAKQGRSPIAKLLLHLALKKIESNDISSAKIILYECRSIQMKTKDIVRRFHLGMGLLHYHTKNYASAFKHLLENLEISQPTEEVYNTCLECGILSEKVYSFAKLISLWKEGPIRALELAQALEEGDAQKSVQIANAFNKSFAGVVEKKALTIKLLNYFFSNQQRCVSLPELAASLSLPLPVLEEAVLEILGGGLMKGTIDGISGMFTYTWIGYKHLTDKEISSIKEVVSVLKSRVEQVIQEVQ
ncbi:26S proteasome regulatory subunit N9 [Nematocida sp. AWRm77]|nr:26S proteasome regulatory subunit N9 [Nematocida sp. AWRm77]